MAKFGSKFGQGNEDEAALRQARMRNFHPRRVNHRSFVEKNIEVDDPGPARDQLLAAEIAFDRLQLFKQLARRERSLRFDNAIQKPGLREKIDRLSLVYGGAAQNSHANFRQGFDRVFQIRGAIVKIRPEGKINELGFRHTEE